MDLDLIDRKILYYLDENARESIALIAKRLKIGRNVALYRLNRLKERGIIKGSFTEINSLDLGYLHFRVFLKLSNYSQEKELELVKFIKAEANMMWFSKVLGKWNFDFVYMTKSVAEFENFRKDLFFRFNSIIKDYAISTLTEIDHYPRNYLVPNLKVSNTKKEIKATATIQLIDITDNALLEILAHDATTNIVDIAKKLRLSINTVKKRITSLKKKGIILGFRLFIDLNALGMNYYKVHINLKNYTEKDFLKVKKWIELHPNIPYNNHYINGEDFEIEIHTNTEVEYLKIMSEFYKEFGLIISDSFMIKFSEVSLFRYLPNNKKNAVGRI